MANLLGDGFSNYVRKQIKDRQKIHGKKNRTPEEISYLNSTTSWIKVASAVSVDESRLKMLGLEGTFSPGLDLAKEFVLFNGTSKVTTNKEGSGGKLTQRQGINMGGSAYKNSAVYGLGGTDFGSVPMPGIVDMSIDHAGTRGSLRKATVTLKAYNKSQLDLIDVLYLRLGFTLLIEWGHSQYIDSNGDITPLNSTLLEEKFFSTSLNKKTYLQLLPLIEKKRFETGGNYDALFGRITNFKWSFESDGTYNITLDLYSLGDLAESLTINHAGTTNPNEKDPDGATIPGYGDNIISDYLLDIKVHVANRFFLPDEPLPETQEEQEEIIEPEEDPPTREPKTERQAINSNLLNERLIKEGLTEEKSIKDSFTGELVDFVKFNERWYYKKNITQLVNKVEIVKDETSGGFIAKNITNDQDNPLNTGWEKIKKSAGNNTLDPFDPLTALLGLDQTSYVGSDPSSGAATRKEILEAKIIGGASITDETGAGGQTPTIFTKNIAVDIQQLENSEETITKTKLDEISSEVTITDNVIASTVAEYNLNQKAKEIQDILIPKDIQFFINSQKENYSEKFGEVLTNKPLWGKKQPNGEYLFPQPKPLTAKQFELEGTYGRTSDIVKLDYQEPYSYFIRFGTFLDYLKSEVLYKIGDDNNETDDIPNTPIIDIDTDILSNVMYTLPNQISLDPRVCVVNTMFTFQDTTIEPFFGLDRFQSEDPYYGKVMNIYLNFDFIDRIVKSSKSNNSLSLYQALSTICLTLNQVLGGVNNLEPVIDEKTNCLKIIDSARLPNIKKITDFLHNKNPKKYNYPKSLKDFKYNKHTLSDGSIDYKLNLYGYDEKDNSSNFIHNVDLSTSVTKNMSTMLAIGAAAQGGYVVGEESTGFSKWNEGIHDRFHEPILDAKGDEINSTSSFASSWDQARIGYGQLVINSFMPTKTQYSKAYYPYWGLKKERTEDGSIGADPVKGIIDDALIQSNLTAGTEFYRVLMASASISNNAPLSGQPGFLPINLSISMEGISGIKIYEKANVDISFLPTNYPQTLDFLSTGLSHILKDNRWETTLTTQATSIGSFNSNSSLPSIFSIKDALKDLDIAPLSDLLDDSGYDIPIGCFGYNPQEYSFVKSHLNVNTDKFDSTGNLSLYGKAQNLLSNIFNNVNPEDGKGVCAKYVKNLAEKFIKEWDKGDKSIYSNLSTSKSWNVTPGLFTSPQSGTQDAKSKLTHENLISNLAYTRYMIGTGVGFKDIRDTISSLQLFPGDIIIYFDTSATDGLSKSYQKYGHIQMYLGVGKNGKNTYISDFIHSPFVYGKSNPNTCWNIILLKSKLNPLTSKIKASNTITTIGKQAQTNTFSPLRKL
jgi:hypothetical protein